MSSLVEFTDRNGAVLRGYPVVIIGDVSSVSVETGSKTAYMDTDGRAIHATPLVIVEDFRASIGGGSGGGGGGGGDGVLDGGSF